MAAPKVQGYIVHYPSGKLVSGEGLFEHEVIMFATREDAQPYADATPGSRIRPVYKFRKPRGKRADT